MISTTAGKERAAAASLAVAAIWMLCCYSTMTCKIMFLKDSITASKRSIQLASSARTRFELKKLDVQVHGLKNSWAPLNQMVCFVCLVV